MPMIVTDNSGVSDQQNLFTSSDRVSEFIKRLNAVDVAIDMGEPSGFAVMGQFLLGGSVELGSDGSTLIANTNTIELVSDSLSGSRQVFRRVELDLGM